MNQEEALRALETLAASPAAKWIGNKLTGNTWLQKCTRCGVEETLALPPNVRGPEDVPAGFDEKMFDWKRSFQIAHEGCLEGPTPASPPPPSPPKDLTVKRVLSCETHGQRTWQGHIMCNACGQIYQTTDARKAGYVSEICRCRHQLLPPEAERVGDILGLQVEGIVIDIDAEGKQYQTPEAQDWTARPICYLCYRYFAKHHGGRVPLENGRN